MAGRSQAEVEGEGERLKDVHRQLKDHQERASKDDGERTEQAHQIRGLGQRIQVTTRRPEQPSTIEALHPLV